MFSYDSPDNCKNPINIDIAYDDGPVSVACCQVTASAVVNEFGKEADRVDVKWYRGFHEIEDGMHMEGDIVKWELLDQEYELPVVETCGDDLYVHAYFDAGSVYDGFTPGTYKVQFYRDGKMIASDEFNLAQ